MADVKIPLLIYMTRITFSLRKPYTATYIIIHTEAQALVEQLIGLISDSNKKSVNNEETVNEGLFLTLLLHQTQTKCVFSVFLLI